MVRVRLETLSSSAGALWRDTSGVILPYIAVLLVVFIGVAALALDGGRAMSLQTQMQKAADALATAGAAELDRLTTSTGRAYNAVITSPVLTNSSLFGGNVAVSSVRFLSVLPTADNMSVVALCTGNSCTTAQSVQARFIEVTVTPISLSTIMPTRFVRAAMGPISTGASAVAGMDQVNCGLTPLFICNPFEQTGDSYDQATARLEAADASNMLKRKLIRLADHGPSGTWGPGDFGYLVPEPGTLPTDSCFPAAGDEIGKATGMDRPLVCVRQNGVDLLPGNANAAKDGLNTRFGLYGASFSAACRLAYPPDENVRKGMRPGPGGDWCRAVPDGSDSGAGKNWPPGASPTHALPADSCLLDASCSPQPNIGANNWDCSTYWTDVYGASPTYPSPCTSSITRYQIYQAELGGAKTIAGPSTAPIEKGTPDACTGTTAGTANRRVIHVAIVNCMSSPVTIQSNAQNVPVAGFGKFFLTHPTTNSTKPYAEFMGLVDRGSNVVRDLVQLYR
jgi:Flp pilus assembly protein TadG